MPLTFPPRQPLSLPPDARVLVTGGVRSGKSRYAEGLLADRPEVTYLAPGPARDPKADPEWAARVDAHRARRPARWQTVEGTDVADGLRATPGPVLLDCLGTWLTRTIDELGTWDVPLREWEDRYAAAADRLVAAWADRSVGSVAVTNEVGWGVVPAYASGRLFADLLGRLNQRVAAASDEVVLVVAGRPLRL